MNEKKFILPKQLFLKFHPPTLILEYIDLKTEKKRRRKIKLEKFINEKTVIQNDSLSKQLASSIKQQHLSYFAQISQNKLEKLIQLLIKNYISNIDLNKLSDKELEKIKSQMDKDFNKKRLKPGDEGYQYDIRVDFNPTEKSEWDDDD